VGSYCEKPADIDRQLRSDNPFVLHKREELPSTIGGKDDGIVAARVQRRVQKEAGEGVGKAGRSAGNRRLRGVELIPAARVIGLRLE